MRKSTRKMLPGGVSKVCRLCKSRHIGNEVCVLAKGNSVVRPRTEIEQVLRGINLRLKEYDGMIHFDSVRPEDLVNRGIYLNIRHILHWVMGENNGELGILPRFKE